MKRLGIILFWGALMWSGVSRAQSVYPCVVIEMTNAERMEILLNEMPRIVYDDDVVTLTTNKTTLCLSPNEILKVYIAKPTLDIRDTKVADGTIVFQNNLINLLGFAVNEDVTLFTTAGHMLWHKRIDASGHLVVSLSQLPVGIYILKTSHQTIKFTKK
jgi:hypothetical protein